MVFSDNSLGALLEIEGAYSVLSCEVEWKFSELESLASVTLIPVRQNPGFTRWGSNDTNCTHCPGYEMSFVIKHTTGTQ